MGLIDTHTHLESFAKNGTLPDVLTRAQDAGLEAMITIGTSPEDWGLYRDIARKHSGFVYYTVGLHPCSVDDRWSESISQIESFGYEPPYPVALGECGLDRFHLPKDPEKADKVFAWQRAAFAAQLDLARRMRCPLVVHSRGAFRECVEMIDASGISWSKVVFHCFTEGEAEMSEIVGRGGFASITGVVTYKSAAGLRDALKRQEASRTMVETDAPYLTPEPHRGKANEPAWVVHTAAKVAEVLGLSEAAFTELSSKCAREFFGLAQSS